MVHLNQHIITHLILEYFIVVYLEKLVCQLGPQFSKLLHIPVDKESKTFNPDNHYSK